MKTIYLTILIIIQCSLLLKSQDEVKLYYNSNWEITKKEKATYFRESKYNFDDLKLNGQVKDYTLSDSLIMEGNYLDGIRNGDFIFYYKNSKIKSEGKYENGRRAGLWKYYYNDGKPKQIIVFKPSIDNSDFSVVEYFDRNGKQLIKSGTGTWVNDSIQTGMFDHTSLKVLFGQFKDGLKTGEWKLVRIADGKVMHVEKFRKGRFISGIVYNEQFDCDGIVNSELTDKFPDENIQKFVTTESFKLDTTAFPQSLVNADVEAILKIVTGKEYKIMNRNAGYSYGDYSLLEFIASNIQYPINAIEHNITGKVYVSVVIDSLGNAKNLKILKGVNSDLDLEALRVIGLIKNWLPAISNGKAIESKITIPVYFQIDKNQ